MGLLDGMVVGFLFIFLLFVLGNLMVCLSVGLHQNDLERKIDLILKKVGVTPDEQTSEAR
jgi:hypothetical protein